MTKKRENRPRTPEEDQLAALKAKVKRQEREKARLESNIAESRTLLRMHRRTLERGIRELLELARHEGFDPVPKLFEMMFPEMVVEGWGLDLP